MESVVNDNVMNDDNIINSDGYSYEEDSEAKIEKNIVDEKKEEVFQFFHKMLIVDELPFVFVEHEGFRYFCKQLCPKSVPPSRKTVTRDCYSIFIEERSKLKDIFSKLSSRVCLTTDTWTSGQNLGYMYLTAHFIDDQWRFHKKIINFCPIPGLSGEIIGKSIEKCLNEWNLRKILTVTVDNASSNDVAIQYLRRRITHWGGSVLDGRFLHMRCAAHILNLVVKDGLKELDLSIARIRGAVRFVRSSPNRLQTFKACMEEENITSKSYVFLDIETRWNSTFLMLETALKFKKAFDNLYTKGGAYCKELRRHFGVPDYDDWRRVEAFLPFLQIFYETTLKVSGSLHVTSNSYNGKETLAICAEKTELEKYLSEEVEPNDLNFDILEWWSGSQMRYPVLALMARDVLAIPISTVASESAFSTEGRVLDSFRTSLTPRIAEALICSQDWLRQSQGPLILEENLLELEELEDG
ncbi:hypothetical protein GQ457_01G027380 [Hibiscus cannabinus]